MKRPKTRYEMIEELEDWYSNRLFDMDEEDLRDEYNSNVVIPGLKKEGVEDEY